MKLKTLQQRVFDWQRNVADQPVTKTPTQRNLNFISKQLGFVRSEWFDEFLGHAEDYNQIVASIENAIRHDEPITKRLEKADELREAVADDIGDVAFTLLGFLNANAIDVDGDFSGRLISCSVAQRELDISDRIEKLEYATARSAVLQLTMQCLNDLVGIAQHYGIGFYPTLEAVCDSNDTKLWTKEEVAAAADKLKANRWTVVEVHGVSGDRCMRVKNTDGKLMKSPSFTPPDLTNALDGYAP